MPSQTRSRPSWIAGAPAVRSARSARPDGPLRPVPTDAAPAGALPGVGRGLADDLLDPRRSGDRAAGLGCHARTARADADPDGARPAAPGAVRPVARPRRARRPRRVLPQWTAG